MNPSDQPLPHINPIRNTRNQASSGIPDLFLFHPHFPSFTKSCVWKSISPSSVSTTIRIHSVCPLQHFIAPLYHFSRSMSWLHRGALISVDALGCGMSVVGDPEAFPPGEQLYPKVSSPNCAYFSSRGSHSTAS